VVKKTSKVLPFIDFPHVFLDLSIHGNAVCSFAVLPGRFSFEAGHLEIWGDEVVEQTGNYPNPARQRGIQGRIMAAFSSLADAPGCENDSINNPLGSNCFVLFWREGRNNIRVAPLNRVYQNFHHGFAGAGNFSFDHQSCNCSSVNSASTVTAGGVACRCGPKNPASQLRLPSIIGHSTSTC